MSTNTFSMTILPAPPILERDVECFRLFRDGGPSADLRLVSAKATSNGVTVAIYKPNEI